MQVKLLRELVMSGSMPTLAGETVTVAAGDGRDLIARGLAEGVGGDEKAAPAGENKMAAAPENKAAAPTESVAADPARDESRDNFEREPIHEPSRKGARR